MSNHSKLRFLLVLLFAAFATAALVSADIGALAQNANSSTTGDASAENANANMMAAPRRGRRGRRRSVRRRAAAADAATTEATATGDASQDTTRPGDISGEQTDLSGTYSGHVRMSDGHDMEGNGTLTITGNQFTLEGGGMTHNGRVYAVTTRGYIGAAFYFPDITNPATNTPVVANTRVRKRGGLIWIEPVPNTSAKLWFSSGGRSGGTRRARRGRRPAVTAPPAETPSDSTTPPM